MSEISKVFKITNGFQTDVEAVLCSGLLNAEDQKLLHSFLLQMQNSTYNSEWMKTATLHGILVGGAMLLWHKKLASPYVSTGIYTISTACLLYKFYLTWWKTNTLEKLQLLIDKQKHFSSLLQDLLQLIQENELLDRGFTMVQTGSSLSLLENTTIHHLGKKWHTMPSLWSVIANNTAQLTNYLANVTRTLISTFLLGKQFFSKEHFAVFQSAVDLGLTEITAETDGGLSVSHLKKMHHTYLLLQSEFLASLALCYYTEREQQKILWLRRIYEETEWVYTEAMTNLRKEFDSLQCINTIEQNSDLETRVQKKKTHLFYDIYVSVHSAVLHFQAMFHRAREIEGLLIQKIEHEQTYEEDFIHNLQMYLYNIRVEMGSCKSCIEEGIAQVQKLLSSVITPPLPSESSLMVPGERSKLVGPSCITESYIEVQPLGKDEILSVITTQEDFSSSNNGSELCESLISEDKWHEQRQKELSQRVLLELKTVLDEKRVGCKHNEANTMKQRLSYDSGLQLTPNSSPRTLFYNNRMKGILKGGSSLVNIHSDDDSNLWKSTNSPNSSSQSINVLPVDSDVLNSSPLKPGDNWPLPRLKKGSTFCPSSKSNGDTKKS